METKSKHEVALELYDTAIDDKAIERETKAILDSKVQENNTPEVKKTILSCLDLTSLNVTDSMESAMRLAEKVNLFDETCPDLPNPAAICTFPNMAKIIHHTCQADGVKTACVAGGFPFAQTFSEIKIAETSLALHDGAEEIDIAIPAGQFLEGDYETICDEIEEIKSICGDKILKVILETATLQTAANIKKAAILAMYAGADFIKTSTGKAATGATPQAALVICKAIGEYYRKTGRKIGFKAAGGITSTTDAIAFYTIAKETLGSSWLNKNLFRIGASSLANTLVKELTGSQNDFF